MGIFSFFRKNTSSPETPANGSHRKDNVIAENIRKISHEKAHQLGYPINKNLPLLEMNDCRSLQEATERLLCLHSVMACACGYSKKKVLAWLTCEELNGKLSESEKYYLNKSPDSEKDNLMQWQVEALWGLAWYVGVHNELDFSDYCSDRFVQMLPDIRINSPTSSFRQKLCLKPKEALFEMADLAYCLHWAIRDAEIKGQTIPGKVHANVVKMRRHALEWLISQDDWDEVALDT